MNNNRPRPLNFNRGVSPLTKKPLTQAVKPAVTEDESIIPSALGKIQAILDYIGYRTYLLPHDSESKIDQLFVSLETEHDLDEELEKIENEEIEINNNEEDDIQEEETPLVHIFFLNDLARENAGEEKIADDTFILQFFTALPVSEIKDNYKPGLVELITTFNRFMSIGHFGFSEQEGIYFRYCLMLRQKEIDSVLLVEIMQTINFIIKKFGPEIINQARGLKMSGKIRLKD
jgi:hypothetical protein